MLTFTQLEQALQVSDKDVKDASSGVLKDLQRFQGQKEEDLKRYMVSSVRRAAYTTMLTMILRSHMQNVTSTGPRRMSTHGKKL